MAKEKHTEEELRWALKKLLDKKKLTYEKLEKKSGVSKAYLTKILVHNKIPSIEIIEKIANALELDPDYFKEYRILRIIRKIEKYFSYIFSHQITQLEKTVDKIISELQPEYGDLKPSQKIGFDPAHYIMLGGLTDEQKKYMEFIRNTFVHQQYLKQELKITNKNKGKQ